MPSRLCCETTLAAVVLVLLFGVFLVFPHRPGKTKALSTSTGAPPGVRLQRNASDRVAPPGPVQRLVSPTAAKYVLFDSNYGELCNQRFSLVNALFFAETLNATLVIPFSRVSYPYKQYQYPQPRVVSHYVRGGKSVQRVSVPHALIGRYYDYHRRTPSIMFLDEFSKTPSFLSLSSFGLPMNETDYSYYLNFTRRREDARSRQDRRLCEATQKSCVPQAGCRGDEFYRQGSFGTDVLLLEGMYAPFNCTENSRRWLDINYALRPRRVFEGAVDALFSKMRGPVLGIHIRVLVPDEEDGVIRGRGWQLFEKMVRQEYREPLIRSKSVYVAYKPEGTTALVAERFMEMCRSMKLAVFTSQDMTSTTEAKSTFDDAYSAPMLDIAALSRVDILIGRQRSTFSKTIVYLREARRIPSDTPFYSGAVFKSTDEGRRFTCSYYKHLQNRTNPACIDK